MRGDLSWDKRCLGLQAMIELNQLASTSGSMPKVARIDLAALVVSREKLAQENIRFGEYMRRIVTLMSHIIMQLTYFCYLLCSTISGNFSDQHRFNCAGCNDGYFTQYLVRNRGWSYSRLPLDGLRSLMFHGPSPTHCIAAGNVWFDHPRVGKVGCLSHETVHHFMRKDHQLNELDKFHFDWKHYNSSDKVCIRLSQYGTKNLRKCNTLGLICS
jgi:hypothetical protein